MDKPYIDGALVRKILILITDCIYVNLGTNGKYRLLRCDEYTPVSLYSAMGRYLADHTAAYEL